MGHVSSKISQRFQIWTYLIFHCGRLKAWASLLALLALSKVCSSILTESFLICRFIGERNRSLFERLFWVFFVSVGIFGAAYFCMDLLRKWDKSPVYMSVESTSELHVKNVPFPAVTICSVNKIVKDRLAKSIKGLASVQEQNSGSAFNATMDLEAVIFMIDSMIRYDRVNFSDPYWLWVAAQNSPNIKASDLLKLFRSVSWWSTELSFRDHLSLFLLQSMPQCKDLLMHCSWQNEEIDCLRLFRVMTTDDGFCCAFNAQSPNKQMKE